MSHPTIVPTVSLRRGTSFVTGRSRATLAFHSPIISLITRNVPGPAHGSLVELARQRGGGARRAFRRRLATLAEAAQCRQETLEIPIDLTP
eukprot:SM000106S13932  [mRNA]  locus=s106:46122:46589:+ [translate_table: standard]